MKIALLSDIHGNIDALKAVLAHADAQTVDMIINCGDTLSGPLAVNETAQLLMQRRIPMIAGNHERQVLTQAFERQSPTDQYASQHITAQERAWLANAAPDMWLPIPSNDVYICHGTPHSDLQYWLETVVEGFDPHASLSPTSAGMRAATHEEIIERMGRGEHTQRANVMVCGHSHVPRAVRVTLPHNQRQALIVNPGSVGLPAYDDDHPYLHWVQNYAHHARYAVLHQDAQSAWQAVLHAVDYDPEPMAALALANGRKDWAVALRTGRVDWGFQ